MRIYLDIETLPSQREDKRVAIDDAINLDLADLHPPKSITNIKSDELRTERLDEWRLEQEGNAATKADDLYRATALDGGWGELAVIGWAVDDGPVRTLCREGSSEAEMLAAWFAALQSAAAQTLTRPLWIGHNVGFDLRFLHHRSVVLGIKPTLHLPYNDAPWRGAYVDTMYEWCGARGSIKLVELCAILGIECDDEIDGSQVWDAWQAGEVEKVVEHCRADVERVRQIDRALRWER